MIIFLEPHVDFNDKRMQKRHTIYIPKFGIESTNLRFQELLEFVARMVV